MERNHEIRRLPIQREAEVPQKGNPKPQYRPGFGPQGEKTPTPNLEGQVWWIVIVIIILVILGAFFLFDVIKLVSDDFGLNDGGSSGGSSGGSTACPTYCDGPSITVAPGCSCPAGSRYYNTITNPPSMYGHKQCLC